MLVYQRVTLTYSSFFLTRTLDGGKFERLDWNLGDTKKKGLKEINDCFIWCIYLHLVIFYGKCR